MDSEAFICLYVSVDMTTFECFNAASSFLICIFTFIMSRLYLKMKVMWPIFHTWAIFAVLLYIHVSTSWNICVRNFKFNTCVHLWPMLLHTNNVVNISSSHIWQPCLFILQHYFSKSWSVSVRNFKFYTHVYLSTVNVHINIFANILSIH